MATLEEIGKFGDIPLEVHAELDRKTIKVRNVLQLEVGSVIRMNRSAGENIDLLVGDTQVAFGEIVIIGETIGVRITDFSIEE